MEIKITDDNFEEEVKNSSIPVLVDFYADWCGPCKMMAPLVAQLADAYEGKCKVGKCNTDENPALTRSFLKTENQWRLQSEQFPKMN